MLLTLLLVGLVLSLIQLSSQANVIVQFANGTSLNPIVFNHSIANASNSVNNTEEHSGEVARSNTEVDEELRTSYFDLFKNQVELRTKACLNQLDKALEKLRKHRPVADAQDNVRARNEWIVSAEVILLTLKPTVLKNAPLFELQKISQLIGCVPTYAANDLRSLSANGVTFKFVEQNPVHWLQVVEERVHRIVRLINELAHLADEIN